MERPTSNDMMPKRDHERDLELDKKIEALRRKNEALMRRYQEVEEDRKRAEEEGMALQSRKGKADDLTITISKSTSDSRVVVTRPFSGDSPARKGQEETVSERGGEGPSPGPGRGRRKQLTVTMAGKKGRRVVSERTETTPGPEDAKSPTDDGQARRAESAARGKPPNHVTKREAAAQEEVKQGQQHADEHQISELCQEPESQRVATDLNIPTTQEEQEEYLRWKKEREQIDRERVARHKNAKGQWRRAWDMDKTENMFSDKSHPERERGPPSRGGRAAKRGQPRSSDSRGHERRGKEKGAKNVLVMSSKAKGKDRLTGRARRWQADEEEEHIKTCETTLEEFLEELDALTDPEIDDHRDQDFKAKLSPSPDVLRKPEEDVVDLTGGSPGPVSAATLREDADTQEKAEPSSPRGSERKVRFVEDVRTADSQDSAGSEPKGQSSLKASPLSKTKPDTHEPEPSFESAKEDLASLQDQGGQTVAVARQQAEASQTECSEKDTEPSTVPSSAPPEKPSASLQESPVQPVELTKCNISSTNAEELIDSGLSVLSLESGETLATHSTSSDKAREHGKIV